MNPETLTGDLDELRGQSLAAVKMQCLALISKDVRFYDGLRREAIRAGQVVLLLHGVNSAARAHPAAVLVDLDLPDEAGWHNAETILGMQSCPPVILLTARTEGFDVRTALRAGLLMDKATEPARLIEAVERAVASAESRRVQYRVVQRLLVQWLSPDGCGRAWISVYQSWGISY